MFSKKTEKEINKILVNFSKLSPTQQEIINYLAAIPAAPSGDHVYHGNFTEITKAINHPAISKSVIRRMILDLHQKGLVNVKYKDDHPHSVEYIELVSIYLFILSTRTYTRETVYMTAKRS